MTDLRLDGGGVGIVAVRDCMSGAFVESQEFGSNICAIDLDGSTFSTDS